MYIRVIYPHIQIGYSMALYVKDPEVDRLAERLAALCKVSKTEVVRQALTAELERVQASPTLVELGLAFCRDLKSRGNPQKAAAADKGFIDSLYEDR
jgi:antitoxin VapB